MTKGLTTVVVPCYNGSKISAHITMACLANITRFTDVKDYELILIEDCPVENVRDDYKVLKIDSHIVLGERTNYATKMNEATNYANGEFLAFIQNDCFVYEGWLPKLRYYLENKLCDCIVPDQTPRSRAYIKQAQRLPLKEGLGKGNRDACMMMMTRDAYEKSGGFNGGLEAFVEADFYERCGRTGVRIEPTNKVAVTHITLATHYQDMDRFNEAMDHDSIIRNR